MERNDKKRQKVSVENEKRIMVVGDNGCGKTSLISCFVSDTPVYSSDAKPKHTRRTINFGREKVEVVLRECENKFHYLRRQEYSRASAVLVCFSFDDNESMENIPIWIDEVTGNDRSLDVSVVGCKVDLKHQMSISANAWSLIENCITPYKYLECSARTGEGVGHLVRVVGKALVNQTQRAHGS